MLDPTKIRQQQNLSNVGLIVNQKKMQIIFFRAYATPVYSKLIRMEMFEIIVQH